MVEDVRNLIKQTGKTIPDLAKALKVADSTVYRWESGETSPRLDQFFKLQELLKQKPYQEKEGA